MAVANEEADLAIANSYYIGLMLSGTKGSEQLEAAKKVSIHFPNQNNRGAHINISGGGIAIHSKNKDNAIKLLEFLSGEVSQNLYGKINFEYPANPKINPSSELVGWGIPKEDQIPIIKIAELGPVAQRIIDRVGW